MKTLYAVPWIEVEYGWGSRDEGFKVFDDLEQCKACTLEDSMIGNYKSGGGYMGPVRPLCYYEFIDTQNISENKTFPFFVDKIKYKSDIFKL